MRSTVTENDERGRDCDERMQAGLKTGVTTRTDSNRFELESPRWLIDCLAYGHFLFKAQQKRPQQGP